MEERRTSHRGPASSEAPLPADRAFVVQFRPQAERDGELFVGRVEHIASGTAERFGSAEVLLSFIRAVLSSAVSPGAEEPGSPVKDGERR